MKADQMNSMPTEIPFPLRKKLLFLAILGVLSFTLGLFVARSSWAEDDVSVEPPPVMAPPPATIKTGGGGTSSLSKKGPKIVYPKNSKVDFEGLTLQGEVRNPGEFYFQRRPEEKFDSLVKRRKNFQKEMLRDVVISK